MTLNEYEMEAIRGDGLTEKRLERARMGFLQFLLRDVTGYADFIDEMIKQGVTFEQDDYFGTEGMDI